MKILQPTETRPLTIEVGAPKSMAEWFEQAPKNVQQIVNMQGTKGHEIKFYEELGKLAQKDLGWFTRYANLAEGAEREKATVVTGH